MTANHDPTSSWTTSDVDTETLGLLAELVSSYTEEEDRSSEELFNEVEDTSPEMSTVFFRSEYDDDSKTMTEEDADTRELTPGVLDAFFGWLIDILSSIFGVPEDDVVDDDLPAVPDEPIADVSGDTILNALEPPEDYEFPVLDAEEDEPAEVDFLI